MTLESLDLFKLLHLSHLTKEEKTAYLQNLVELVLADIINIDLPVLMSEDEIKRFNELADREETKQETQALLRDKVPDFDNKLKARLLELKRDLVAENIAERIKINEIAREEMRALPESAETISKIAVTEQEMATLEQILAAINDDDWATVDSLFSAV